MYKNDCDVFQNSSYIELTNKIAQKNPKSKVINRFNFDEPFSGKFDSMPKC